MRIKVLCATMLQAVLAFAISARAQEPADRGDASASLVPTFHCMGIYWSPMGGGAGRNVLVEYRQSGQPKWRTGLPLRFHPVATPECRAEYRGSLVNLMPGTSYDIRLTLEGTDQRTECRETTWSENFPVHSTVKGTQELGTTLTVDRSGSPGAYVLYDGTDCTIDTGNKEDLGIAVNASYVILRNFTIRNVKEHGIRIFSGHHIIIEGCDISKWGDKGDNGWAKDYQAGVFSSCRELGGVVIQRCRMHHPAHGANSWAEKRGDTSHPMGPQAVVFWESAGNHVIRYNEIWSDRDHYFNDGMGAGYNGSYRGFPGADSDIYGNYIAYCRDDGVEAEGGGRNVRIWNNYVEEVLIPIANAAVSIGPLYVWRNVSGRSSTPAGSAWGMSYGHFMKMGFSNSETWMTGHMYVFNNTIFQEGNKGAGGLGGNSRIIRHCTTRNNILHVREADCRSIAVNASHSDNDFDYDLVSAGVPDGHEKRGIKGAPQYIRGAGFDPGSRTGLFQLAGGSRGIDAGVVIPNFCEEINGNPPDLGAHESGTGTMTFGIRAQFVPPGAGDLTGVSTP